MSDDICDRLMRFAGKVCLSTDTEVEAADEIERLRAENEKLRAERDECERQLQSSFSKMGEILEERNVLRAALKCVVADMNGTQFPQTNVRAISVGALNAAAAALKETEDE